jgi:hypothetical protein
MRHLLILFTALLSGAVYAQDCTLYFPSEKGTEIGYTYYSKPGKVESSSKMLLTNKNESGGKVKMDITAQTFDAKGQEMLKFDYSVWCDGDNFYIDMKSTMGSMNLKELGEFKIESTDMQFPAKLSAGQKLKDASISLKMEGPVPMGITTNITNCLVEGFEKITTPAGTFDCAKISYDQFSKVSIIKTEGRTIEWYAPNVGLVRSETYSKKDKLLGINELSSLN